MVGTNGTGVASDYYYHRALSHLSSLSTSWGFAFMHGPNAHAHTHAWSYTHLCRYAPHTHTHTPTCTTHLIACIQSCLLIIRRPKAASLPLFTISKSCGCVCGITVIWVDFLVIRPCGSSCLYDNLMGVLIWNSPSCCPHMSHIFLLKCSRALVLFQHFFHSRLNFISASFTLESLFGMCHKRLSSQPVHPD